MIISFMADRKMLRVPRFRYIMPKYGVSAFPDLLGIIVSMPLKIVSKSWRERSD